MGSSCRKPRSLCCEICRLPQTKRGWVLKAGVYVCCPRCAQQRLEAAPAEGDPSPLEAQPKRQRAPRKAASEPAILQQ
eukprot:tig00021047_g18146.t1